MLYISPLVIGPINIPLIFLSSHYREYTAPSCRGAPKAFHSQYQSLPSQVPIYTPGWREAIIVKHLAQGHKCHDRDSNPHSGDLASELEFDALNHSDATLYRYLRNVHLRLKYFLIPFSKSTFRKKRNNFSKSYLMYTS